MGVLPKKVGALRKLGETLIMGPEYSIPNYRNATPHIRAHHITFLQDKTTGREHIFYNFVSQSACTQRCKNLGSRVALLCYPNFFWFVQNFFARITEKPDKLSGFFLIISHFLDGFKTVWIFPYHFPFSDGVKTVQVFSRSFPIFWTVSKPSRSHERQTLAF